jgi:hypothetical protein
LPVARGSGDDGIGVRAWAAHVPGRLPSGNPAGVPVDMTSARVPFVAPGGQSDLGGGALFRVILPLAGAAGQAIV